MANVDSTPEPAELIQLLDEHHLVMLAEQTPEHKLIQQMLCDTLRAMPEAEVIELDGRAIATLTELNHELALHHGDTAQPRDTLQWLLSLLRTWPGQPRHRYIVWNDADVMLDCDVRDFGRAVNALCLAAATFEHLDLVSLVLHRCIFIGGPKLGAYAEDVNGQLNAWLRDDEEQSIADMVERIAPIVPRPPVLVYRLDE